MQVLSLLTLAVLGSTAVLVAADSPWGHNAVQVGVPPSGGPFGKRCTGVVQRDVGNHPFPDGRLALIRKHNRPTEVGTPTFTSSGVFIDFPGQLKSAARNVRVIIAHRGASAERPECTAAAIRRAIEVGATAVEVDVRTSKDGHLVILHDKTLDRTTNGKGPVGHLTLAQLKKLDAGSWFDKKYRNERIPTLPEVLQLCRGRIDVLLDLKEQGDAYDRNVIAAVNKHGSAKRTIVGVRSLAQAKRFRKLLPKARQLGLIPKPESIESFARAGVETIRLWPRWLKDGKLVPRVKAAGAALHLNGSTGKRDEIVPLLKHGPRSLSSDDPGRLVKTLRELGRR